MRIKGFIFVVVLAGLAFGATFFITDERVEAQIEKQLTTANGAMVEIDGLIFDLAELHIAWDRLQWTNPKNTMQNVFETGKTEFDVQFWPLVLRNKVVINNVQMTGFELETERATDGYFLVPLNEEAEDSDPGFFADVTGQVSSNIAQNANMQFTDVKDDINVDSLLAKVNLQSIDKMDSLKTDLQDTYTEWDSTITNNSVIKNVEDIKKLVDSLKLDEINDVPKAIAAVETIQKVKSKADSLKNEVTNIKENFVTDINNSRNSLSSIDDWVRADINSAANVAKLPEINAQSIGTALFGQSLLADLNTYLGYVATGREYGSRFIGKDADEEEIERYEGRNYNFTEKYDLPKFWIKNIELSGVTKNDISLSGVVTNVSSNQRKSGEPVMFSLGGQDANEVSLTLNGMLNYLTDEKHEQVEIAYRGFSLRNSKISPSELLPYQLNSGTGDLSVELNVIDKRIDSEVSYVANDLSFDFESAGSPKNTVERLIRNAIGGTDEINATALIDNTTGPLRVRVRSNVDDLFLNTLKSTVQAEVENAKRQIRNEVENRVNGKRREVEQFAAQKEAELRAYYDEFEARINQELQVVEKKKEELEAKKKELEESILDNAVDALKKKIGF